MKHSSKYVGLDVHQATTVTAVREECGRGCSPRPYPERLSPLEYPGPFLVKAIHFNTIVLATFDERDYIITE